MEDLIPVTLWMAGRSYRIRVAPKDEAIVRKSVKVAEERLAQLRNVYAGKDEQDFIAMCLLMYATEQATDSGELNALQKDQINRMIEVIDKNLSVQE